MPSRWKSHVKPEKLCVLAVSSLITLGKHFLLCFSEGKISYYNCDFLRNYHWAWHFYTEVVMRWARKVYKG